ncbi:MAG: alpha-glucan family phosphorylase [Bacteroidales bacterium]|nr:alpha-glucan family phosphorylase [Bacteroidales bacterium]
MNYPQHLFEVCWEVCNKIGGIHTVVNTKAPYVREVLGESYILIGPDLWRESGDHPEFNEKPELFKQWKMQALKEDIRVRTGYLKNQPEQKIILIDFTSLFIKKDEIFSKLWEKFKLDSLSGQWDYIEPALFGYAAGMAIESFCKFHLSARDKIIAHFHEWMTGAGILYLKEHTPYIVTTFTTHATIMGRSIAGNNRPLYENIKDIKPELTAIEFNLSSKYSLEKLSAQNADAFTTVSNITDKECKHFLGKSADHITPNGFDNKIIPDSNKLEEIRSTSRHLLIDVAKAVSGKNISNNAFIIGTSGRYEFRNKGLDVYLDSLWEIANNNPDKDIIGYIMVPAANIGPDKKVCEILNNPNNISQAETDNILTHYLHNPESDPIVVQVNQREKLKNLSIIFAPTYLDGKDGIFNLEYYDVLPGFDITIFASYYEPWGYTPMESIAYKVPTVTTSLSGFGTWIQEKYPEGNKAVAVIKRDDNDTLTIVNDIANAVTDVLKSLLEEYLKIREIAEETTTTVLWKNLIKHYFSAYDIALNKLNDRIESIKLYQQKEYVPKYYDRENTPHWRNIEVSASVPDQFAKLSKLAENIWWSWNFDAVKLFKYIDHKLWRKSRYNPIILLKDVSSDRFNELAEDLEFIQLYNDVVKQFEEYMAEKTHQTPPRIAYFCMEYGFNDNIKIFSGGLGILAGDYLKEASDYNANIIGVGLLYRHGYFKQKLSPYDEQLEEYIPQNFSNLPVKPVLDNNENWKEISVVFPGRTIFARIWELAVGRNLLYLLDTDYEKNDDEDRKITHQLYGGDSEHRFKQEMILGVGGIRLIRLLDIKPDIYHVNEGHAAFIGLERLRVLMQLRSLTFSEALDVIRSSTLFTTHTPVPAGHDAFAEDLLRSYMAHYPSRFNITWEEFMNLGKAEPTDEKFSMSFLAANMAQEINGVSMLHGKVSRNIFQRLYKDFLPEELHIGYVTNGVHYNTWTSKSWHNLYRKYMGNNQNEWLEDSDKWKSIYNIPDDEIWKIRQEQRSDLVDYLHKRIRRNWIRRYENPKNMIKVLENLNENTLTIGFARRFATYKRAHLLFKNTERLRELVNNKERPIQFIFAGKAHPNDKAGKDLIKHIIDISKQPEFLGKIIFLENYDINLARKLVQGVDIWLNTPTRPLEASGTSGMKVVLNGGLHFSVIDGWWVEGYKKKAGWALSQNRTYDNQEFQNDLDSETLYSMFENEIIPLFYKRNSEIPTDWIQFIKKSLAEVAPQFTTRRMIKDYYDKYYKLLYQRSLIFRENNYEKTVQLNKWKKLLSSLWSGIQANSIDIITPENKTKTGDDITIKLEIFLNGIAPEDIRLELLLTEEFNNDVSLLAIEQGELIPKGNNIFESTINAKLKDPGTINYTLRIVPYNALLPYKADFNLVKWL